MDAFAVRSPDAVSGDEVRAPEGIVAKPRGLPEAALETGVLRCGSHKSCKSPDEDACMQPANQPKCIRALWAVEESHLLGGESLASGKSSTARSPHLLTAFRKLHRDQNSCPEMS